MCGIYGYIGQPTQETLKLFEELGIQTEIRGTHATGIYGLNSKVLYYKEPIRASEFYEKLKLSEMGHFPTVLIGHNRLATHGDPTNNINNHPFISRRFGFIHNGVVGHSVEVEIKSECDSERIFNYFRREFKKNQIIPAIANTLRIFDEYGKVACSLVDNKERVLYLFRNAGYEIYYVKFNNLLIFASTSTILRKSLMKFGIEARINLLKIGITKIDEHLNMTYCKVKGLKKPIKWEMPKKLKWEPKWEVESFNEWEMENSPKIRV